MQPSTPPAATGLPGARPYSPAAVRALLYALMVLYGVTTSTIGPALPSLAGRTGVALDTAGLAFTFNNLGMLAAVLTAGVAVDRAGRRPVLTVALALLALGLSLVPAVPSFALLLAALAVVGLGQAGLTVTLNVIAGDLDPFRRAAALNQLHLMIGLGSFLGPAAIGAALAGAGIGWVFWAAAAVAAIGLAAVRMPLPAPAAVPGGGGAAVVGPSDAAVQGAGGAAGGAAPHRMPVVWLLAAVLLVYVGTELSIGNWLFVILQQATGLSTAAAAAVTSAFWLCITAGRLAGAVLLRRRRIPVVLLGAIAAAGAGALLLALGHARPWPAVAGALLAGLAFGPVFPTTMGWATTRAPHAAGQVTAMCIAGGSLGAMVLPWALGRLMVTAGVGQALLLPAALTGLMGLLVAAAARLTAGE